MNNEIKIHKISAVLQYGCYLIIIANVLLVVSVEYNLYYEFEEALGYIDSSLHELAYAFLGKSWTRTLPAFVLVQIPVLIKLYAFSHLSIMFKLCKQNLFFTTQAAHHLFVFALMLLLNYVAAPLSHLIAGAILTFGSSVNPLGFVNISIDGNELSIFVIISTLLAVSWIMLEGLKLAKENAEFV